MYVIKKYFDFHRIFSVMLILYLFRLKRITSNIRCIGILTYVYWQLYTQRLWIGVIPISKPLLIIYAYTLMQYRCSKTDEAFDHKKSWLHSSLNTSKNSAVCGLINIPKTFERTRHNLLPFLQFLKKFLFNAVYEEHINSLCPL